MSSLFSGMLMKAAAYLLKKSFGTKAGNEALAHAAPVLNVVAQAAGDAAAVKINEAASTNGNLAAVAALVNASLGQ